VIFAVQPGFNYTVRVYYANSLKAVKDIYFPANETTMHVTVPISITAEERASVENKGNATSAGGAVETVNWAVSIFVNPVIIAVLIIMMLAAAVAKIGGTEIGLVAMTVGIAVFTVLVPVFPPQILAVIGVTVGVLFGLRLVRK
jgi:hypothetical protein